MNKPPLPAGLLEKEEIDEFLTESIDYQLYLFGQALADYEPAGLFDNLFKVLRAVEELQSIPMELDSFFDFTSLEIDSSTEQNRVAFKDIQEQISRKFSPEVSDRFSNLFMMCVAVRDSNPHFDTVSNVMEYFGSRRFCLVATLLLIPHICKGQNKFPITDTLSNLLYPIERSLVNMPATYFNLLKNKAIPESTLLPDGRMLTGDHDYDHLEYLFTGPIWMSLLDRNEFSEAGYKDVEYQQIPVGKAHSYGTVENTFLQFSIAYEKYAVASSKLYQQIASLIKELKEYCADGYTIIVPVAAFEIIAKDLMPFLVLGNSDYSNVINSSAAFVIINDKAQSSVTLMMAFVNQLLAKVLSRNKNFQLDSAVIFEQKTSDLLAENGFVLTEVKHINQKEFDLVATKNNTTCNFHCKNNLIDVVQLECNYKKIDRLNTLRIKKYERDLSSNHFVISRFPVLTSVPGIINFSALDEFLKGIN